MSWYIQAQNSGLTHPKTLLITIFPGAQIRDLYGYFDGQLKVQYTEPQRVTASNFEDIIGKVLKWSLPDMDGETTDVVTLPTIMEGQEEEDDNNNNNITALPETFDTSMILHPQTPLHPGDDAICLHAHIITTTTTTTTSSTTNSPPNTTSTKPRYPKKRHSCYFHTCTVAAKNLVESRRKNEMTSEQQLELANKKLREWNKFNRIRRRNLGSMKRKS